MDPQTAARKAAFCLAGIILTLISLVVLSQPASAVTYYPTGTTLKASGPGVYLVSNGGIYGVPNPETLTTCLGGWGHVKTVSDGELNDVIHSYPFRGSAACRVDYPDKTTIMVPANGTVYVISAGKKYWVPNAETVVGCLGGWGAIRNIGTIEMAWSDSFYPGGGTYHCPYSLPNGSKLLAPGGTVYVVVDGKSYGIPSIEVLNTCFGGWNGVRSAAQTEIDQMTTTYPYSGVASCPYTLPNGSKLLAPSGTVYVIVGGKNFAIPSIDVLNQCYGGWSGVRSIDQTEFAKLTSRYGYAGTAPCASPTVGVREQRAVDWARAQLNSTRWNGMCELFVEQAYGTKKRYTSAIAQAESKIARGEMHTGDRNVPAGALVFFNRSWQNTVTYSDGTKVAYGHVMLSLGGGQFISTGYTWNGKTIGVFTTSLNEASFGPYIGWAWADAGWSL